MHVNEYAHYVQSWSSSIPTFAEGTEFVLLSHFSNLTHLEVEFMQRPTTEFFQKLLPLLKHLVSLSVNPGYAEFPGRYHSTDTVCLDELAPSIRTLELHEERVARIFLSKPCTRVTSLSLFLQYAKGTKPVEVPWGTLESLTVGMCSFAADELDFMRCLVRPLEAYLDKVRLASSSRSLSADTDTVAHASPPHAASFEKITPHSPRLLHAKSRSA